MKKFVFIDIDGTLYDKASHCVPESAKTALKMAKERGHELFICTGRTKGMVESTYHQLPVSGFVYGCGAHIEKDGQLLFSVQFPKEEMDDLMDYFQKHDIEYTLEGRDVSYFSEASMQVYMSYFCDKNPEMKERFTSGIMAKKLAEVDEAGKQQVLKMAFQTKNEKALMEKLNNLSDKLTYFIYSDSFSGDIEGEILVKGADKADSIDRVIEICKGNLEDTIAIGDSDNDISMIQKAGIGIAMGNACDSLKEAADYITTAVSEDGLYTAFEVMELI